MIATGVEFFSKGQSFFACANKEVILSAGNETYISLPSRCSRVSSLGALLTPQASLGFVQRRRPRLNIFRKLLELSGIGDAKRLSAHGIPCLIDLPQVGENYQVRT